MAQCVNIIFRTATGINAQGTSNDDMGVFIRSRYSYYDNPLDYRKRMIKKKNDFTSSSDRRTTKSLKTVCSSNNNNNFIIIITYIYV